MKFVSLNKKLVKPVVIIALLTTLLGTFTACAELGYPPSTPEEEPEPEPEAEEDEEREDWQS